MDRASFQRWLDAYVEAWKSYDPGQIGELFSEEAEYHYRPRDEPVRGRQAIVDSWLADRDAPGTYDGRYSPLAIDGEVHVSHGVSSYFDGQGRLRDEYSNVFLCRFDAEGRCTSFTDYWIQSDQFSSQQEEDGQAD
jgi:hypothetical protein